VAQVLARARGVEVVMTGGSLRGSIHALVGSMTEHALSSVQSTRAFISGNGVTAERGLSTPNVAVAGVDRALAAAGREVVVLADHTKIGVDAMMRTVPVSGIAHLVTDDRADRAQLEELRSSGVRVHVAAVAAEQPEPVPG
jgi:DeoR/GlpR family transcriptional regulator of sugar metabolism